MADINFSFSSDKTAASQKSLKRLKTSLLRIWRRAKGFLSTQQLPHVASKACSAYLTDADQQQQAHCRRLLQTRLELNPTQLQRFFQTPMGDRLLAWLGRLFHLTSDRPPPNNLQDLLLQMASDPEGLSILSFWRRFPNQLQPNLDQLLLTAKQVEMLIQETQATIAAIQELAQVEVERQPVTDFAELPDLRQPGSFAVQQQQLTFEAAGDRLPGHRYQRHLAVEIYRPQPWPEGPVTVVVQSHGLASNSADIAQCAIYLASHGYFVATPQHPGSDMEQVRQMLAGQHPEVFQLTEFINRPLDISYLLDQLTRRNASDFEGRLNLQSVGMIGYSFGAYTALALAGAEIHFERLEMACGSDQLNPNLSLLLQCRALELPRHVYSLCDPRIQAVLSVDSVGSEIFGADGIGKIRVPLMLLAGSYDTAAPLVFEQVRLFHWLKTAQPYLALIQGKSHIRDWQRLVRSLNLEVKLIPDPTPEQQTPLFEQYIQILSHAFFQAHLAARPNPAYLNAAYARFLSQPPFDLWLISQASQQSLSERLQALDFGLVRTLLPNSVAQDLSQEQAL